MAAQPDSMGRAPHCTSSHAGSGHGGASRHDLTSDLRNVNRSVHDMCLTLAQPDRNTYKPGRVCVCLMVILISTKISRLQTVTPHTRRCRIATILQGPQNMNESSEVWLQKASFWRAGYDSSHFRGMGRWLPEFSFLEGGYRKFHFGGLTTILLTLGG